MHTLPVPASRASSSPCLICGLAARRCRVEFSETRTPSLAKCCDPGKLQLDEVAAGLWGVGISQLSALFHRADRFADRDMDDPNCFALAGLSPQFFAVPARIGRLRQSNSHLFSRPIRRSLGGPGESTPIADRHTGAFDAPVFCPRRFYLERGDQCAIAGWPESCPG